MARMESDDAPRRFFNSGSGTAFVGKSNSDFQSDGKLKRTSRRPSARAGSSPRRDDVVEVERFGGRVWRSAPMAPPAPRRVLHELRGALRLLCTPSTCVQFAPGSENFRADDKAPGYRWLELHPDGRIESAVSRVSDFDFEIDLDSGGYL